MTRPRRGLRPGLVLALALASAAAPVAAVAAARPDRRIAGEVYVERLHRADRLAKQGLDDPSPELMARVLEAVGFPLTVVIAGQDVAISSDPYLDALRGDLIVDFEQADAHLQALERTAREALRSSQRPQAIQRALREAYEGLRGNRSLVGRIIEAIRRGVGTVLDRLVHFRGAGTILEWLAVAAMAAMAVRFLVRGRLVSEGRAPGRARRARPAPTRWDEMAEQAMGRGDVFEAVRALYRALLAALAARGLTSDSPSLTAGECRATVGRVRPSLYPAVARATAAYERVAYGLTPPGPEAIEALVRAEREAWSA